MQSWKTGLLAAAGAIVLGMVSGAPGSAKAVKGQAAPDFTGTALDGRKVTLSDYRGKNPVVLNFFAEFCPPCRKEFPHLKEIDEKLGPKGLKILSVSVDEDRQAAAVVPNEARVRFPAIFDPRGAIAEKYEVQALPHTVVIDRSGKVQNVLIGYDAEALDRAVSQVMR
jgi:peroxiredoxin